MRIIRLPGQLARRAAARKARAEYMVMCRTAFVGLVPGQTVRAEHHNDVFRSAEELMAWPYTLGNKPN